MGAFIKRHVVAAVAAIAVLAGGVGVAIAVAQGSDSTGSGEPDPGSRAEPRLIPFEEQETFRPGVPDDPYIDFCPTPEQAEAFAERSGGLDLKPSPPEGAGCGRDGQYRLPEELQTSDPRESLSEEELCQQDKQSLLEAQPIPSDDPLTLQGETSDGREVGVDLDADPEFLEREGIDDIHDWARRMGC